VDILLSYRSEEEIFIRYDHKKVVKKYCIQIKHTWEYTSSMWKE